MKRRFDYPLAVAAILCFLGFVYVQWPKEPVELPNCQIVSYGEGYHGDLIFTNPTVMLLSGQSVSFGNLIFSNQSNCWKGAVILTERPTNLTCKSISVTGGGFAIYVDRKSTNSLWVSMDAIDYPY